MGQATGQIVEQIEEQREHLGRDIQQLESTVRQRVNLRQYVDEHPIEALGLAIAAGVALASLVYRPDGRSSQQPTPQRHELKETLDLTRAALMQVGKKQARSFVSGAKGQSGMRQEAAS